MVRGKVVGVHGKIGFNPLEPRDHAGKGAHVFAETCDRGPRRNGPIAPARHDQLAARANFNRPRRTAGVSPLPTAAVPAMLSGPPGRPATAQTQPSEAAGMI